MTRLISLGVMVGVTIVSFAQANDAPPTRKSRDYQELVKGLVSPNTPADCANEEEPPDFLAAMIAMPKAALKTTGESFTSIVEKRCLS